MEAIAWLGLGTIFGAILTLYAVKKARQSQARYFAEKWKTEPRWTAEQEPKEWEWN